MPRPVHQASRCSIQYLNHSSSVPGLTKYSISICSNSRVRKMKLPGVISLRNDLPIWPMPNGGFLRELVSTLRKRSEEHTSELQSPMYLVCRLLLEKKKLPAASSD